MMHMAHFLTVRNFQVLANCTEPIMMKQWHLNNSDTKKETKNARNENQ